MIFEPKSAKIVAKTRKKTPFEAHFRDAIFHIPNQINQLIQSSPTPPPSPIPIPLSLTNGLGECESWVMQLSRTCLIT